MPRSWFAYRGPNYPLDMLGSFTITDGAPACTDGNVLCAIYAATPVAGQNPASISDNLQRYISNGLVRFTAQPDRPLGSRYFVTMKDPS